MRLLGLLAPNAVDINEVKALLLAHLFDDAN
jgi:hypothetical protein